MALRRDQPRVLRNPDSEEDFDGEQIDQPLQVGAYNLSDKILHEKCSFYFKSLFKRVFSILLIFPKPLDAYFYVIFDQKIIGPLFLENL